MKPTDRQPAPKALRDAVWKDWRAAHRHLGVDEYQRAWNRLYGNPTAVAMLLAAGA